MEKIAAALIVKDDSEVKILKRCLLSFYKHVDKIFITGTKEPQVKIKKLCKEFNVEWSWYPWDKSFANARNFNFAQVPQEYKWIFWCDADDIVVGAEKFRDIIKMADNVDIKAIFARYLYQCEFDEKMNIKQILIEHLRERLIRNGYFDWVAPIHETLIEKTPTNKTDTQDFYVIHTAQNDDMLESMYRNIEILEEDVINNPQDPRPIYYLAKAYFDVKEPMILYDKLGDGLDSYAMELLKDYQRKSGWSEERSQCWEYIGMIHRERNEYKQALYAFLEGLYEEPKFPSIYIQLALTYVMMKDWEKAMHWIKQAMGMDIPKTTLVINPRDYKSMMLEVWYHIYLNTGQLDKCQQVATALLNLMPSDMSAQRLEDIVDLNKRNNVAHLVVKLASHLKETNQIEKLNILVDAIPREIEMEPAFVQLKNEYKPPKIWADNEVVIFCGPGFEKWSPKNTAQGIGGSEEAVIYLSKELTKLGWKVNVYADPQEDAGIYDGVEYVPYYNVNWSDEFNIFVSWRHIDIFDIPTFKAKKAYLWNHDLQNSLTYTPERVSKIDKVMFLSNFHRSNVPNLPEDKIMYTANGINI
jgi:tetratricopeptide (TPR) repeat protein